MIGISRTVLLITDEGLMIYSSGGGKADFQRSVPWDTQNFETVVSNIISTDCGGKSVLILNDMVEQHYRKERIPKVGALDKANVVKNRLAVAFPSYPIRAALPLEEKLKSGNDAPGPLSGGSIYLFAAVPHTEALEKTFEAVKRSYATIAGFCLLPIESSSLALRLSEKLTGKRDKNAQGSHWTIFIGQQRNGNLRQVVTRNNDLALTRLTPIVESDENSDVWSSEVVQEFRATMSYLSRFGYNDSDKLDVILIANPEAGNKVGDLLDVNCNYKSLTTQQAASFLGLSVKRNQNGKNADLLHVAWAAKKNQFALAMKSARLEAVQTPRQVASVATFALGASLLVILGLGGYDAAQYQKISGDMSNVENDLRIIERQYKQEVDKKNAMGIDVEVIQATIDIDDSLEKSSYDPLTLIRVIGEELGSNLKIDRIALEVKDVEVRGQKKEGYKNVNAVIDLSFPNTIKPVEGNRIISELSDRFDWALPDEYKVSVVKEVQDLSYTGVLTETTGVAVSQTDSRADYSAQISIAGEVKND